MTQGFFSSQVERLKNYFGKENYPIARQRLIWDEVKDLPDGSFFRIVNYFIGERGPDYNPSVSHFRDQANIERQAEFTRTAKAAGAQFVPAAPRGTEGLKKALDQLAVNSLMDAIRKVNSGGK